MEARGGGDGGFSPRATVEDIQRRLLRPSSSLHSPPPPPTPFSLGKNAQDRNSSQFEANYMRLSRSREISSKERKLEDYLDPVLLSAISSKINRFEKIPRITVKREVRDFEWHVDELRMWTEDTAVGKEKIDAVNLGNDSDNLIENDVDGDVKFSTPFQKFEQNALVLFEL
ncbi:uncharacterized protein LOC127143764 isoform X2 [Cucumis melo]|uniref:Uncharacterized protein LOC127143764 isoform X2 n=1 Tax=Cucumis melo TaxID=3656 RepID=A0ABM3L5B4_CUCME|nr:uncharacterized protein LOC127143764 isoform X2 [Cucumis melo]